LLLMRHASAGERLESPVHDRSRGLDAVGRADARALPATLAELELERIVSSPTARCVATVLGLARRRGIEIECRDEVGPDASRKEILSLLAEASERTLVCTHREVFERVFRGKVTCEKGGIWIAERNGRRGRAPGAVAYLPPPTSALAAARQPQPAQRRGRQAPARQARQQI
jgi:phosphohistidine phosphatase SixA